MMEKGKMERGVVELVDTESLVPEEHLLRKVDEAVDFRKLYEMVEPLYSEEDGRPSVDPVVLFKIVLLQHLDGMSAPMRFCSFSANRKCRKMAGKGVQPLNNYTCRFRPSSLKQADKSGLDGLQTGK